MKRNKHIGIIVATIADSETDISGVGRINLNSDQPPNGETVFEIGSISKVFTGVLQSSLIRSDKLTLDTSLTSQLSSVSIKPESKKESINIKHLGLPQN